MSNKKTTEEFIDEAKIMHTNKYDYSKTVYSNNRTKVCIICPEHGEFWQIPGKHLSGQGCPVCGGTKKNNNETFIIKANKVHVDKYDYSKVNYINNKTKVCIICPEHGEFWQDPHNHLKGRGCPICGKSISKPAKYTTDTFVLASNTVHGKKYNYQDSNYIDMNTPIKIICPKHGEFKQNPYFHLHGGICPKCAREITGNKRRITKDEFIKRAKTIHGGKYDYSKVEYKTEKHKVCIICPEHGEFLQTPDKHLRGNGCPKCVYPYSKAEIEIYEFIKTLVGENNVVWHDRSILNGKEIDIFIPNMKVGIEYNGLYWHNRDRNYHINKTEMCNALGINLIQIFEDEYLQNKDIVLSKISHILGKSSLSKKIYGRNCIIKEIDKYQAKDFLEKNHIQGFVASTVYIGGWHNEELIGVLSLKKTSNEWELTRFATRIDTRSIGVCGKMFSCFVKKYNPEKVKTFADRRWTMNRDNNLYTKIGFVFEKYTVPEYRYYKPGDGPVRQHKFGFRKKILNKKYQLPLTMTESEMTEYLGYSKIYDCGLIKYVWNKKEAD